MPRVPLYAAVIRAVGLGNTALGQIYFRPKSVALETWSVWEVLRDSNQGRPHVLVVGVPGLGLGRCGDNSGPSSAL